ncbi:MAG TPA: alpha/beta hydrolase [Actinocrinis sp.]|jgi:pimeloyl-ACP methyl ester carboxylesterase
MSDRTPGSVKKSTTVRAEKQNRPARSLQLGAIRSAFGALEHTAPGLGAQWAGRLWCTPVRPSADAVARSRAGGRGELRTLRIPLPDWTGRDPLDRDGRRKRPRQVEIAAEIWGPADGPLVYLLHGWGGWRGQFAPIARALAEAGCRAVAFDAPSHGDSGPGSVGPGRSLLPDFSNSLTEVARLLGPARAVVAHSLGGGCAALAALDGLETERLAVIAPAVDPIRYTQTLALALGFGERIRTRMVRIAERRTGTDFAHFDVVRRAAGRDDLPPLLVVHDEDDADVPFSQGAAVAGTWSGAELLATQGLGHRRVLRDERVVGAVTDFAAGRAAVGGVAAAGAASGEPPRGPLN